MHQFDQFTEQTSGSFHPRGLEVILNSEVWDMRTLRLLRWGGGGGGVAREGRPRSPISLFFSPPTIYPHPPHKLYLCLTVSTPSLRSVPALDGATVTFNGTGDIIYAIQRRPGDGELSLAYLHQRSRTRHPLHTAFR